MVLKDLTDKHKRWLRVVISPHSIIHTIPIEEINRMNESYGVNDRYRNSNGVISFCSAILRNNNYGTYTDDKKLNVIRAMYLKYKK